MSNPQDQDIFDSASVKDPIEDLVDEMNALEESDIRRGALGWHHVPKVVDEAHLSGDLMACGGHTATRLGNELYQNIVHEETIGALQMPRYDHRTANPMRTAGPAAPYGADTNPGWSIVARQNLSTDAAEVSFSPAIPLGAGSGAFGDGEFELDVSGFVEYHAETSLGVDEVRTPVLLGVAVKLGTVWYVIPGSIGIHGQSMFRDSIHARYRVRAADLLDFGPSSEQLDAIGLAVAFRPAAEGYDPSGGRLGTWAISATPVYGEDV